MKKYKYYLCNNRETISKVWGWHMRQIMPPAFCSKCRILPLHMN